jgi:ankyrin repeat protein
MGHLPEATLLCEYGANINVAVASGDTPLMIAAAEGFNDIVTYLCECDHLLIECTNECGQTALHCAVEGGHLLTASLLLDRGANLEATDNVQATPLLVACANGFVDLARMLLERGAKTACVSERVLTMKCDRDVSGATTVDSVKIALIDLLRSYSWVPALDFHRFCQQDDVTNIKRLFDTYPLLARRVYNHVFSAGTTDVEVPEGSSVLCRFGGGASPLMVACLHNSLAVVKFLLEEYDADYSNKSARFLLEVCVSYSIFS